MHPTDTRERSIHDAGMDDVPAIARVLGRAFYDDPLYRWFFPDDETRMARSIRINALLAGFVHVPAGQAEVLRVREGDRSVVRGAALWTPPGADAQGVASLLRSLPHWADLVGPRRVPRIMRYFAQLNPPAPKEPHWHLAVLGTDPSVQGTGVGTRLLRSGLDRADAEGVPVSLETMNPANIGYYERHGFHVFHVLEGPEIPTTHFMLRPTS
ncbi:GNAT family N-acetyltransferase [Nocardiopsis alba]|uniref:GNAT family N-acetyltransferase n=1 Tax=Nocardiopsis alba TaxID=53437 RepID=UPI0003461630|nr:GNAT family N-acetyltransferase [Nocardiopsis alba]